MRWTKIVMGMLALGILALVAAYVYPSAASLLAHHHTKGIVTAVLDEVLAPHKQSAFEQSYPFVLLGLLGATYLVGSYEFKHRPGTTHGSAHAATRREARKYHAPRRLFAFKRPSRAIQTLTGGRAARQAFRVVLGKHRGRLISLDEVQQYEHLLLTGITGAGKSARFFVPNLLRETGLRSLFIADLKNELYTITAGWLSQQMQIRLFAPTKPTISASYNPLAHITSIEEAQDFAATWVANTGQNDKDAFWDKNSRLIITATVLHVLASEKAPLFSRLADILTTHSFEEIRDIFRTTRSHDARYIARQFFETMEKNERQVGSQMTDVGNRFEVMVASNARTVTATNTIDFEEMRDTPTAFFLSIPRSTTRRYRPLMACLTQQMFAAWEQRGTHGIGCYLDEFSNIGYIPGFAEFVSTARSLRVSLMMAIQNFAQLNERYGNNDAETIKVNAITHFLLPGAGLEKCRYYSERIGDTTVKTETINRRGYGLSEEITSTEGETRRRLMTPDELRTMPSDTMLLLEASKAQEDKDLAERASLPYQGAVTYVHQVSPTTPPPTPRQPATGLPAPAAAAQKSQQAGPPLVVDADEDEDESQFFLQE